LEEQYDAEWDDTTSNVGDDEELPDGDALAEAFEEYLRDQNG